MEICCRPTLVTHLDLQEGDATFGRKFPGCQHQCRFFQVQHPAEMAKSMRTEPESVMALLSIGRSVNSVCPVCVYK